jgi:hypothetical protein
MSTTAVCPICKTPQRYTARGLLVDHYTTTGTRRGGQRMRQRCPGSRKLAGPARRAGVPTPPQGRAVGHFD